MKIGICLPYMEKNYGRKEIMDWCRRVDNGPFSSISCGERITSYTLEMRNMLAFAAACTERVRIVPSLYVLPMHSAVWAAKEIATLDVLSEGRVTVAVGVGGREMDYKAVGAPFEKRHQRLDDQIQVMKKIWRGEVPFEGCDEVGPRPYQDGGPPILSGSMGLKPMARAAQWAEGIYGFAMNGDAGLTDYFKNTAEKCWQDAEREEKPYFIGGFWYSLADSAELRLKDYVFNYLRTFGDEEARKTANTMTRFSEENIVEALFGMQQLNIDEVFMVPATADIEEITRLEKLLQVAGLV
jgi:alkanesulfonate monooxygenase SsuD/methylene tetrahydromethanopterin reductase-like flavin-dependent oxidoreductase (luciferase family)